MDFIEFAFGFFSVIIPYKEPSIDELKSWLTYYEQHEDFETCADLRDEIRRREKLEQNGRNNPKKACSRID